MRRHTFLSVIFVSLFVFSGCSSDKSHMGTLLESYAKQKIENGYRGGPNQFTGDFKEDVSKISDIDYKVTSKAVSVGDTIYFVKGLIKYEVTSKHPNVPKMYIYHYFIMQIVKNGYGEFRIYNQSIKEYLVMAGKSGPDPYFIEQATEYLK